MMKNKNLFATCTNKQLCWCRKFKHNFRICHENNIFKIKHSGKGFLKNAFIRIKCIRQGSFPAPFKFVFSQLSVNYRCQPLDIHAQEHGTTVQ